MTDAPKPDAVDPSGAVGGNEVRRAPQSSSLPPPVALPVIPRYRPLLGPSGLFGGMSPHPSGEWVRAEDASRLESRIAALEAELLEGKAAKK